MKNIYFFLILIICAEIASAQTYSVEMVSNLNLNNGSNPRWMTVCDSSLYFFASDGINGHKIFSLSGNNAPALCPNILGAAVFGDGAVSTHFPMGVLNDTLYIPVLSLALGRELYRYDAVNMPVLVMDMNPGNASASPNFMTTYNNKLYFQATSAALGTELWVHDPVVNASTCLTDINPGSPSSTIAFITVYNNKLYFAGSNGNDTTAGNTGLELYCYDAVLNAVSLVADINPGHLPSNPTGLMVANNKLYFAASEPVYGKELYEFDGVNVSRLTDVNPGPAQGLYTSDQSFPTYYNGKVYFCANEPNNDMNLGEFDIATNTTNIIYCAGQGVSGTPRYFKVWDNRLFFSNHSDTTGIELWAKDSNNAPYQVFDIDPGQDASYPKFFTEYNESLYFNAYNDTSSGEELFRLYKNADTIIGIPTVLPQAVEGFSATLSPNPVKNMLTLNFKVGALQPISYSLIDITGRTVAGYHVAPLLTSGVHTKTIDCATLSPGSYFIVFKDRNAQVICTQKLLKN